VDRKAAAELPHSIEFRAETEGRLFWAALFVLRRRLRAGQLRVRLVLERVDDRDVGFDLDGLAVENGWPITPLAHGVGG
jgi:hypothetical protein